MSDDVHIKNTYDDRNIETMEMVYGEGFMSPGGPQEVQNIFAGLRLEGVRVLDLGCGLGGASVAVARLDPTCEVVGVDIEPSVIARAEQLVAHAGLDSKVSVHSVSPGPLPFEAATFDYVYANSVTCHFDELIPLFADIQRVLKPAGRFLGAEWYVDVNRMAFREWDDLLRARGLNFFFTTTDRFQAALVESGFERVDFHDRRMEIAEVAARALARVEGALRGPLLERLEESGYRAFVEWSRARANVLSRQGMSHQHFRACTPAN